MTVHHHSRSIALRASIVEKLCCVSRSPRWSFLLPRPDLFATHNLIFTRVTLNLLDFARYKLCPLFACCTTNQRRLGEERKRPVLRERRKSNLASAPTGKTVSNALLQCDRITAFTGVKWKRINVKQTPTPRKFLCRSLFLVFLVFLLEFWSLDTFFSADIQSIFVKSGDNVGKIMNPKRESRTFVFFSSFLEMQCLHGKIFLKALIWS